MGAAGRATRGRERLLGKLLLLHRFAGAHGAKADFRFPQEELGRLLPFQKGDLERLRDAVTAAPLDDEARVVQLIGRWGTASRSSFTASSCTSTIHQRTSVARSSWSTCGSSRASLISTWPSSRKFWGTSATGTRTGWLHYPLSLFLTRIARQLRLGLSTGLAGEAKLDVPLRSPARRGNGRSSA